MSMKKALAESRVLMWPLTVNREGAPIDCLHPVLLVARIYLLVTLFQNFLSKALGFGEVHFPGSELGHFFYLQEY